MPKDNRDILELLKFELDFLEQGGYGRSVRTPWQATAAFQDSPTCLNFNDADRPHPCSECRLMDFVPSASRTRDTPCHHIPLTPSGETVCTLEQRHNQLEVEQALKDWLRATIRGVEQAQSEEGTPAPPATSL
jgi:hypothetical protein